MSDIGKSGGTAKEEAHLELRYRLPLPKRDDTIAALSARLLKPALIQRDISHLGNTAGELQHQRLADRDPLAKATSQC
mgnify:CR=1 FL=1